MKVAKHNDKTGWLRGAKGIDGAYDNDGREFMQSYDPEWDAAIYGPVARGGVPSVTDKGNYGVDGHDRADFPQPPEMTGIADDGLSERPS